MDLPHNLPRAGLDLTRTIIDGGEKPIKSRLLPEGKKIIIIIIAFIAG